MRIMRTYVTVEVGRRQMSARGRRAGCHGRKPPGHGRILPLCQGSVIIEVD